MGLRGKLYLQDKKSGDIISNVDSFVNWQTTEYYSLHSQKRASYQMGDLLRIMLFLFVYNVKWVNEIKRKRKKLKWIEVIKSKWSKLLWDTYPKRKLGNLLRWIENESVAFFVEWREYMGKYKQINKVERNKNEQHIES